jgi:UDP-glucose 4-epimerase
MKSYLVTGAGGFIGSKLAEKLINQGHFVVSIDNLSTGNLRNVPKGVKLIEGDCQDPKVISQLNAYSFDAIFHIAGQSSGEISFEDPIYDLQTNTQSTLMLLKFCLENKCNRFIYASTMSVYGDQEIIPAIESSPTFPKSLYGVGKLASEHYLRIYAGYGISTTCLRLFNVYGPGQNLENLKQGMVSIFLAQALQNKKIVVKGSLERFRDFVFIDDVVQAFIMMDTLPSPSDYHVFNVCSGRKTTVAELLSIIKDIMGEDVEIIVEGNTKGDQFGITGAYSQLHQAVGWQPKTSLELGLKQMFNWAKNFNL